MSGYWPGLAFARPGFTRIPCLIKHGIWVKSGVGCREVADVSDTQRVLGHFLGFVLGLVACLVGFAGTTGIGGSYKAPVALAALPRRAP